MRNGYRIGGLTEFKRIRYRIALALHAQTRSVIIDSVEDCGDGRTKKVRVYCAGWRYIVFMVGDVVTQTAVDTNSL